MGIKEECGIVKIRDLKLRILKVEYGPSYEPKRSSIDFLEEIPKRLSLENYSLDELDVEVVHDIRPEAYLQTDRCIMNENYSTRGSLGVRCYRPDGKVASLYLVDFLHLTDKHHNPWLWGWDFQEEGTHADEKRIHDNEIPDHDTIPLENELKVTLTLGDEIIHDTFKGKKNECCARA